MESEKKISGFTPTPSDEIDGVTYTYRKIPGITFISLYGNGSKPTTDLYTDMIEAGLESPSLSREEIVKLDFELFVCIAQRIIENHEGVRKNLQERMGLSTRF